MNMYRYYLENKGETKRYLLGQEFAILDLNKVALRLIAEFIYWWTNTFTISALEKIICVCLSGFYVLFSKGAINSDEIFYVTHPQRRPLLVHFLFKLCILSYQFISVLVTSRK